jgi:hypothetical protein
VLTLNKEEFEEMWLRTIGGHESVNVSGLESDLERRLRGSTISVLVGD